MNDTHFENWWKQNANTKPLFSGHTIKEIAKKAWDEGWKSGYSDGKGSEEDELERARRLG